MSKEQYDFLFDQYDNKKFVTNELKRLKKMLEEAGIPFDYEPDYMVPEEARTTSLKELGKAVSRSVAGDRIACPCHAIPVFSVIEATFSYGGREDRLECWNTVEEKEPSGYLTAEDVFESIQLWFEENSEDERQKIYEAVKKDWEKGGRPRKRKRGK
jgi:hypothetical protein